MWKSERSTPFNTDGSFSADTINEVALFFCLMKQTKWVQEWYENDSAKYTDLLYTVQLMLFFAVYIFRP